MQNKAEEALSQLAGVTAKHMRTCTPQSEEHSSLISRLVAQLETAAQEPGPLHAPVPGTVRALRNSPEVFAQTLAQGGNPLADAALEAFAYVNWTEFYAEDDWSWPFLPEFANGEGIGPDGVMRRSDLILGLFVLGPNTNYPIHAHPAEEFYLVVSGQAEFQVGVDAPYKLRQPGELVLHRENEAHSIATSDKPLFAIFGWIGDLSEPSWYRDDMSDPSSTKHFPNIRKS
jgi:mannose-6-phosphate isomerase-like protein (cupin superfamily)